MLGFGFSREKNCFSFIWEVAIGYAYPDWLFLLYKRSDNEFCKSFFRNFLINSILKWTYLCVIQMHSVTVWQL